MKPGSPPLPEALQYVFSVTYNVTDLNTRHIGLRSLTENIDTTTPGGRLIFHVFGALAAFERDLVKERTMAGLAAAAARAWNTINFMLRSDLTGVR
jgi:DNA invertase Pin-like site-specific DNA recombinase